MTISAIDALGKAVYVSGNTYPFKDRLKQYGTWDARRKAWLISTRDTMRERGNAKWLLEQLERAGCVFELKK